MGSSKLTVLEHPFFLFICCLATWSRSDIFLRTWCNIVVVVVAVVLANDDEDDDNDDADAADGVVVVVMGQR